MTTYDRILHALGLAATALVGAQATGIAPPHYIPVWMLIAAWVISSVAQTTTGPVKIASSSSTVGVMLLAAALALGGCAHTSPPVTAFGHCTERALTKASQGILGRVMTALAMSDYVAELAALATQFGGDEVGCAVDLAIAELTGQARASNDEEVGLLLSRAQNWRGSNP